MESVKEILNKVKSQFTHKISINQEMMSIQNGQILYLLKEMNNSKWHDREFSVFSQWGDDGLIQYLINKIDIKSKSFIEFGVGDYQESNTRYLMMNNNWKGLIIEGNKKDTDTILNSEYYWKYDLLAVNSFITVDNINDLIQQNGFEGNIGLLHIDIDGNDYWVWEAIKIVQPDIAIIEYNSLLGSVRPLTIPYKSDFERKRAHSSNLYAGVSLAALCYLANKKGYFFVGSNSAGNNAYFVLKEKISDLIPLNCLEGYVQAAFRESRGINNKLNYLSFEERQKIISKMEYINVTNNKIEKYEI